MILYDLQCSHGHQFEGWFASGKSFVEQLDAGLVACTICGGSKIEIAITDSKTDKKSVENAKKPQKTTIIDGDLQVNADPVVLMKALRHVVTTTGRDAGANFTNEVMKMRCGDTEHELIFGTATDPQQDALDDEDIEFTTLPDLPDEYDN